jgi:hypothetical protein
MSAGDPGAAPHSRPPRHRLHPLTLAATSWRTAKMEPARVVVPGLVIFGLDAVQGTFYTISASGRSSERCFLAPPPSG